MINKLRTLMAFSAISLSFAALPAFGGEIEPLRVTVPFAFTAGKTTLPAGQYTVSQSDSHVFMIRGAKTSILVLGSAGSDTEEDRNALSFHHTDKGYALTVIRTPGHAASLPTGTLNAEK